MPEEAGLAVDWEATASQASGLILRPTELVAHLRGEVEEVDHDLDVVARRLAQGAHPGIDALRAFTSTV